MPLSYSVVGEPWGDLEPLLKNRGSDAIRVSFAFAVDDGNGVPLYVALDVLNAAQFCNSAPDRGDTALAVHVENIERHFSLPARALLRQ